MTLMTGTTSNSNTPPLNIIVTAVAPSRIVFPLVNNDLLLVNEQVNPRLQMYLQKWVFADVWCYSLYCSDELHNAPNHLHKDITWSSRLRIHGG